MLPSAPVAEVIHSLLGPSFIGGSRYHPVHARLGLVHRDPSRLLLLPLLLPFRALPWRTPIFPLLNSALLSDLQNLIPMVGEYVRLFVRLVQVRAELIITPGALVCGMGLLEVLLHGGGVVGPSDKVAVLVVALNGAAEDLVAFSVEGTSGTLLLCWSHDFRGDHRDVGASNAKERLLGRPRHRDRRVAASVEDARLLWRGGY